MTIGTISIDLTGKFILPHASVGMVLSQPMLEIEATAEPYKNKDPANPIAVIRKALDLSMRGESSPKIDITLLPEYSIPGLNGFKEIEARICSPNWPTNTMIIGGIDGLTKAELQSLITQYSATPSISANELNRMQDAQWVNCCLIWVKCADGTISRWVQLKISRAWAEANTTATSMYAGNSVFSFKGRRDNDTPFRFAIMICYDWVAKESGTHACMDIIGGIEKEIDELGSLTFLFVITKNPAPSHDSFLKLVPELYRGDIFPKLIRDKTCIVFANTAGHPKPGVATTFGHSSLIFSGGVHYTKKDCQETVCTGGERFGRGAYLTGLHDYVLRERGACIHMLNVICPEMVNYGAENRQAALATAEVHPIGSQIEPRAPGGPVPASVKWLNDELDQLPMLAKYHTSAALSTNAKVAHGETLILARPLRAEVIVRHIRNAVARRALATSLEGKKAHFADNWKDAELKALIHIIKVLTIFRIQTNSLRLDPDRAHARTCINTQDIDLVAISGETMDDCLQHAKDFKPEPRIKTVIILRDSENIDLSKSILSIKPTAGISEEHKFTVPDDGTRYLGYKTIEHAFATSASVIDLAKALHAALA